LLSHEILRRDFERISRVLIIRLRSLGDSILALPLIEALNAWRPDLEVDVLVEAPFAAVFSRHPAVHETLLVQSRNHGGGQGWSRLRTCFEIRRRHYDAVVNLHGGSTSLLCTATSGAGIRIGQQKYRNAWAYNARIPAPPSVWQRADLHTVEDQLTLLPWLGIPVPDKLRGRLHLDNEARARIQKRLETAGVEPSKYILIHPTATQASKQWKEASFAALADRLEERHSFPVIFSAAPREGQVLLDIGRHARHARRYWCDVGLADLFALIAGCKLFIGNDSGPTHAAAALGKSLVVIWGSSDFRAWHPWDTTFESARSNLPCMPCPGYTCAVFGHPKCIEDIPVEMVEHACDRFLTTQC
jgi:predicted lipopolysaccharide heptosyltransferase III